MRPMHIAFLVTYLLLTLGVCNGAKLHLQKIKGCPRVKTIVRDIIWDKVRNDTTLAAKLLRLHYHDCFVRGCDGSILLDSNGGNATEKDARPNSSIAGYEIIDEVKAKLEQECPGLVSCADILALAARDAVSFQFGKSMWPVFLGRKDGRVSLASEANRDIPSAGSNFTTLQQQFASQGLNLVDLVALSGAHTIGVGRCVVFQRRLFNFTGNGDTDPSLDPDYAKFLKEKCSPPANPAATRVGMDPNSTLSFDGHYFVALNKHQGLFQSDAALLTNPRSKLFTRLFENDLHFFRQFGRSMIKMGAIGVITGKNGEIRKNCRAVN
ncbi:hypothetical protein L6164_012620 [Bauhinia variegata]|uniref:Uncharacterized protein n=1 Tax=Bauhinia variegata TaxID=167791 RepID=A0ACB9PC51_BAUVA|nr:hypothetical protein L6164_012620 [Bauhinia variegata]